MPPQGPRPHGHLKPAQDCFLNFLNKSHTAKSEVNLLGASSSIGIGIERESYFQGPIPAGSVFLRISLAEYEDKAEQLRQRMQTGVPGSNPPGWAAFQRYPRTTRLEHAVLPVYPALRR